MANQEKNKAIVQKFFEALETEDAEQIANLFAEYGVHINPYHCDVFPTGAEGRDAIRDYWAPTFGNFDGMEFPIHEICAMENGEMFFVHYTGRIKLKNEAGWYTNDYYSTFKLNSEGEITEYVEIFNPVTAAKGFGLLDKLVSQQQNA